MQKQIYEQSIKAVYKTTFFLENCYFLYNGVSVERMQTSVMKGNQATTAANCCGGVFMTAGNRSPVSRQERPVMTCFHSCLRPDMT